MEGFGTLIKSVCIISASVFLINGLAAGTRFKNQMKFLLNLVFITVISTPILKGTLEFDLPDIEKYMSLEYDDSMSLYHEEMKKQTGENISAVLKQQIEAAGINCTEIETEVNISETNSISISRVTVSADNFEAAAEVIRNSLGAETEVYNGNS
ncbi:MAG: hypothetical protein IJX77_10535 [Ruminococcus sp.]|nr:hypothetical protein [Ruminococcus sp.]